MGTTTKYSRLAPGRRREQMLDAANALFAERGYDEVSVEDIASSAGVTRGLVHHYFGGRKQVYIALLERLGSMREQQLPPPVGRSARARVADSVSRWLDWTEQNRTIWLATLGRGEDIADPDVRAVVLDLVRRAVAHPRRPPRRHRRRHPAAALRARMLDRPQPRRHPPLATRRNHPPGHTRTARHNTRTRPTHLRQTTQAKPESCCPVTTASCQRATPTPASATCAHRSRSRTIEASSRPRSPVGWRPGCCSS